MKTIRIHYHPRCAKCARLASLHGRIDGQARLEVTCSPPPSGPVRPGEIAVVDRATGEAFTGAAAHHQLKGQIPPYDPAWLLLLYPFSRVWIDPTPTPAAFITPEVPETQPVPTPDFRPTPHPERARNPLGLASLWQRIKPRPELG